MKKIFNQLVVTFFNRHHVRNPISVVRELKYELIGMLKRRTVPTIFLLEREGPHAPSENRSPLFSIHNSYCSYCSQTMVLLQFYPASLRGGASVLWKRQLL